MKISVPDDSDLLLQETTSKKENVTLEEEMRQILRLPQSLSSFTAVTPGTPNTPECRLQMLFKFTQYCRQEVFPRHANCIEFIQSRSNKCQLQLVSQQQEIANLLSLQSHLQSGLANIEDKLVQAQETHQLQIERLKVTLAKLQDCCKKKTIGEQRMKEELMTLKKTVANLNVHLTDTKAKKSYFLIQLKIQSESDGRCARPVYIDKDRTIFMRSSLNMMGQDIQDLVQRIKLLQNQALELADPSEPIQDLQV